MPRPRQGRYTPRNPNKYKGDLDDICYRSGLERTFFRYCDLQPHVVEWSSEPFFIPYVSPKDDKVHRYFPDIVLTVLDGTGARKTWMVEIKPKRQTRPPRAPKNTQPGMRFIKEALEYAINAAKWEAAQKFCVSNGWIFKVITEEDINPKRH